ncbi:MAG TPA: penicillin-binding transpeptidase domain-containing protein [Thermoanaerobaculia bacterium]|nr:penicillin-binding transpeptidase domain-containing protein [Thermoanaerobaculia bacterium]
MTLSRKRLVLISAILTTWALIVVARLGQVQIARNGYYVQRAQRQQERTLELNPVRGSLLDARGRVLAESVAAESVYADPQAVPDHRAAARALARIPGLRLTAREIQAKLDSENGFVWIARQVPLEVSAEVRKLQLSGVDFLEEHRRAYPRASLAASVIGYVGVDGTGLAGIEHSFDAHVRGRAGRVTVLKDARRGMYVVGGEGANRAVNGNDVVLTIDAVVQYIAERALAKAVSRYRAAAGTAIVMDPRDGAILAMVSLPSFDPNRFTEYHPTIWRNRNVQDIYEPGSTFKIVAASAAIEERVVTPSQIVDCGEGFIRIANIEIGEHDHRRFGLMTFEDAIAHSSNVGTIRVAMALGNRRLYDYARRFGFGERTRVTLPGEATGLLRRTERWSLISNASISIGQEIGATALQVAGAMAVVANGGMRVQPRIVDRVVDAGGDTIWTPPLAPPERVVSDRTAALLNEMLKTVVARGTGTGAALPEHIAAGKSGTAQKAIRGGYSPDRFVASFAGYVPADRPRLVILVNVDEPKGEQYGGKVAAPVFKEIAEATLRYLGVPPSLPQRSITSPAPLLAAFSQRPRSTARSSVPDLVGLDARTAVAQATSSGLLVQANGSGVVKSQQPNAGEALPEDRRISLQLAEAGR